MIGKNEIFWYPIRVTYSREMKVKDYLDMKGIESFIPMCYIEKEWKGEIIRRLSPVVHNLIFIRTTPRMLRELKQFGPYADYIRYMMDNEKQAPITIADKQMQDFIAVAGTPQEHILYLTPTEVQLKKGDKVRINAGIWKGVEGTFVRIKAGLRVVVSIQGIMAVATASLHPSLVDRISQPQPSPAVFIGK